MLRGLEILFSAFRRARNGVAALEFALMAPLILLLVFAVADLGIYFAEHAIVERTVENTSDAIKKGASNDDAKAIAQTSSASSFVDFSGSKPDNYVCAKSYPDLASAKAGGCSKGTFDINPPTVTNTTTTGQQQCTNCTDLCSTAFNGFFPQNIFASIQLQALYAQVTGNPFAFFTFGANITDIGACNSQICNAATGPCSSVATVTTTSTLSTYYVYVKASAKKTFHVPFANFMPEPIEATNIVMVEPTDSGKVVAFDKAGCDGTAAKCCPDAIDWELYTPANGRVIIGIGDSGEPGHTFHSFGSIGGEEKHLLTKSELPKHHHRVSMLIDSPSGPSGIKNDENGGFYNIDSSDVGGDDPHNNMMPYKTLYYCKKK